MPPNIGLNRRVFLYLRWTSHRPRGNPGSLIDAEFERKTIFGRGFDYSLSARRRTAICIGKEWRKIDGDIQGYKLADQTFVLRVSNCIKSWIRLSCPIFGCTTLLATHQTAENTWKRLKNTYFSRAFSKVWKNLKYFAFCQENFQKCAATDR